jgi:hypothetical protein
LETLIRFQGWVRGDVEKLWKLVNALFGWWKKVRGKKVKGKNLKGKKVNIKWMESGMIV